MPPFTGRSASSLPWWWWRRGRDRSSRWLFCVRRYPYLYSHLPRTTPVPSHQCPRTRGNAPGGGQCLSGGWMAASCQLRRAWRSGDRCCGSCWRGTAIPHCYRPNSYSTRDKVEEGRSIAGRERDNGVRADVFSLPACTAHCSYTVRRVMHCNNAHQIRA